MDEGVSAKELGRKPPGVCLEVAFHEMPDSGEGPDCGQSCLSSVLGIRCLGTPGFWRTQAGDGDQGGFSHRQGCRGY